MDPQVKMVEIKLSQGAKPGHGGVLPGPKVTPEIAAARGVIVGQDCVSPAAHSAFSTPIELMHFIVRLRELSGGKPVGFKLCIGHPWEWFAIVKAMLETGEVIENLDLLFSLCWDEEFAATQAETTVPPEQWAAASRGKEDEEWWLKSGPRMLAQWAAWHTPDNPWQVWRTPEGQPAVELELNLMLGGVPVKMIIDRVLENQQGDLMVCDIKTGSSMPKHNLQLAFYAAGLDQMFGVRPRWGAYWMGRSGSTSPLVDLTHLSTDKIVDIVVKFEKARHQQVFLPNLSSCSMCGVKNACHWAGMTMEGK
jgi:hypothetical protein